MSPAPLRVRRRFHLPWRRRGRSRGLAFVTLLAMASVGCGTCLTDIVLLPAKRELNRLKNRTTLPTDADIDRAITLEAMLAPGADRTRWSHHRAGSIEGVVVRVHDAARESANCFSATRVDAHIEIAQRFDAPPNQRIIVEVTPPMRDWAAEQGSDWSTATLQRELTGRRVRIQGWMMFDEEHDREAENTNPGRSANWRATAWELHPVTAIQVMR
jgi:hypothetical protein